jgi:hypothetical protein
MDQVNPYASCDAEFYSNSTLLKAYYHHFHRSHPFLPPEPQLSKILTTKPSGPLRSVIQYAVACYTSPWSREALRNKAEQSLYPNPPKTGLTVQAMLLLAIILDGDNQQEQAVQTMALARASALELGMQHNRFASLHGEGSLVLEESWRRTWWELFVVDGMFAAAHQQQKFRLYDTPSDMLLPCEETQYLQEVSSPCLWKFQKKPGPL